MEQGHRGEDGIHVVQDPSPGVGFYCPGQRHQRADRTAANAIYRLIAERCGIFCCRKKPGKFVKTCWRKMNCFSSKGQAPDPPPLNLRDQWLASTYEISESEEKCCASTVHPQSISFLVVSLSISDIYFCLVLLCFCMEFIHQIILIIF